MTDIDYLVPTRESLLTRLKDWNDHEGWKVFFETYWRLIYITALKAGLTEEEAQDVVQETVIAVAKSIPNFKYDRAKGSFKGWLLRVAGWRIRDQIELRHPAAATLDNSSRTSTDTSTAEKVVDPAGNALEEIWNEEWEKNLIQVALNRVKRKVDPKSYQVYDFFVFKGYPAARVASALKVPRPYVYLVKHRLGALIKREILALRNKPI